MTNTKKTLGQYLYQIHREKQEWEFENISLGLIPDEEKLSRLKGDLYRKLRADGDVKDLVSAIATLENSLQQKFLRDNTLEAVTARFVTSLLLVGFSAAIFSFPISWGCGDNQTPFCRSTKWLSNSVKSEFQEPLKPNKVLPLDLLDNAN